MRTTSWFNTMLIHQNRVHHTPKNAISERYLPRGSTWWCGATSTSAWWSPPTTETSPCRSPEARSSPASLRARRRKSKLLLEVQADPENPDGAPYWRGTPIPLETVRPFKYTQISLADEARRPVEQGGLGPDWTGPEANAAVPDRARGRRPAAAQHEAWVHALLERNVEEMIEEVLRPHVARPRRGGTEVPLPLIRLRVDYPGLLHHQRAEVRAEVRREGGQPERSAAVSQVATRARRARTRQPPPPPPPPPRRRTRR